LTKSKNKWPPPSKLEIVTPEAKIFSDDVDMVTLTGIEGEMGIYARSTCR
jgi:F0F1-type ATP synthase epsilon subunit